MGSVKYKTQPVVLPVQIPRFSGFGSFVPKKRRIFLWKSREPGLPKAFSEGMPQAFPRQGAEAVQFMWNEVEKWTTGLVGDRPPGPVLYSRQPRSSEALPKLRGRFSVAQKAQGTKVIEIALPAAFSYGNNVVGVPEASPGGDGLQSIKAQTGGSGLPARALQRVVSRNGVDIAKGAAAVVAREDLLAQIAGVGTQPPLVYAEVAAEGAAAPGENLELAPAAERKPVRTSEHILHIGAAAGKCTGYRHVLLQNRPDESIQR